MRNKLTFKLIIISVLLLFTFPFYTSAQKKNNVRLTTQLKGDNGVVLKIDIEYSINKKKILKNDRYVEYTITNVGDVIYNGTIKGSQNAIVFDLTTDNGKVIEKAVSFIEILSPGKSTMIKYFIADVGPKISCTGVKPSRLDFWSNY